MIDEDSIRPETNTVASYGLDSMIGSDFRNWMFREFKVDVSFQQLLSGRLTIVDLAKVLYSKAIGE